MLRSRFSWHFLILIIGLIAFSADLKVGGAEQITGGKSASDTDELEENFRSVPGSARPWVYWWWLKGNVTKESVTWELEEMKKQGIGGVLLFDSRGYHDDRYDGRHIPLPLDVKLEFMSPGWREVVKHAMREASRLGLKMSINLANTGGALRGPWDMGAHGPKQLHWTAATVVGPAKIAAQLEPRSDHKYSWEVALLAVQTGPGSTQAVRQTELDLNTHWQDVEHVLRDDAARAGEVINLEPHLRDGQLYWEAPPGEWRIIRYNCVVSWKGAHGQGASAGEGSVDILNAGAVERYFDLMGKELLNDAGPLAGTTFTHFYNVSWEGVYPNWTPGFEEEFRRYRGYELKPYLPVLAGIAVKDKVVSGRFLRDYHRTLGDCFKNNTYRKIGQLSQARGMKWHSENGGPWKRDAPMFVEADQLEFWGINDMPQAEFWCNTPDDTRSNVRFAAMAAHVYGRPLVSVEAFTHMTFHWSKYPEYLKPFADINFIDGANLFVWHTFTSSPREIGKPGYEYFAGTHLNPNVTWWDKAGGFIDYLGRCQYLLQQGRFVADVLTYVSDRNYVRWGRGVEWSEKPSLTLGRGYKYDRINTEVLVENLSVEDGELALPGGMRYRLLAVDLEEEAVPPEALEKIVQLAKAGATIVLGRLRTIRAPGLANYPDSDQAVLGFAEQLWGPKGDVRRRRALGKGEVFLGVTMDEVMTNRGILPDFEGPVEYVHRKSDGTEIYFIAGTGKAECKFRVKELKPEFWDPVSGQVRDATNYRFTKDGRTVVPIELPENGSTFVVFRNLPEAKRLTSVSGAAGGLEVTGQGVEKVELRVWKSGNYRLKTSLNTTLNVKAEVIPPLSLKGRWEVHFAPAWGAPETTLFEQLILWNEHPAAGIKYFSGTATYQKTFTLSANQTRFAARLKLGKVFNVARVRLNGKDLGVVWTAPWVVEITPALKAGENRLEVEVTNCWANRLIGDAGLPENERYTRTNVRLVSDRGDYREFMAYSANDPLLPSGLSGPVQIEFGERREIDF